MAGSARCKGHQLSSATNDDELQAQKDGTPTTRDHSWVGKCSNSWAADSHAVTRDYDEEHTTDDLDSHCHHGSYGYITSALLVHHTAWVLYI